MQKKYFPIFIDISEKKIVVIGGGVIATRRVNTLLQFSDKVIVVAPEVTPELSELVGLGKVIWLPELYCAGHVSGADMVIAATNAPEINHQVKADCERLSKMKGHQILVSVIDDKALCDFYFPSIVQSEDVVIGINSGGKSPTVTKNVRRQIEKMLDSDSIYE